MTVAEARARERSSLRARVAVPEPVDEVVELALPSQGGSIPARLYLAAGCSQPAPALVWFPGGGWILGSLEAADLVCRKLANETPCAVVAVKYRQAPEHRFPAAVEDCLAATAWVADNAGRLGIDPTRIAVGGASAGGNLLRSSLSSRATAVGRRWLSSCSCTRRPIVVRGVTPRSRERSIVPARTGAGRTTSAMLRETTRARHPSALPTFAGCRQPS